MTSSKDLHLRLIKPVPIIRYVEPLVPESTTVTVASNSTLLNCPMLSLKEHNLCHVSTPKPISARHLSIAAISHQLRVRTILQSRLALISNSMCILGLIGIILMVVENEITFRSINNKDTIISWSIKFIISLSTFILICLIIFYHYTDLELKATQNSLDHWHIGLSLRRIILIIIEILICAIHPMPRYLPRNWTSISEDINLNSTESTPTTSPSYIAVDVALGLPMFARLYLISRCLMFQTRLVIDAPVKSLGTLNQVSINFFFLIKIHLEKRPARFLMIFCCMMFFIGSWSIRACDYKQITHRHISLSDSMWLFIITFTTVGYGDITPSTYCGRTVASIIALFGILSSALLISVFAQKLQLTRWEKYVHNFVSDIELTRARREQAANVIKFAVKVWYLKRKNHSCSLKYFRSERFLLKSIQNVRRIKCEQRKLNENSLDFVELINIQRYTHLKTKNIGKEISTIKLTIEKFDEKFIEINNTMNYIKLLLDKNNK